MVYKLRMYFKHELTGNAVTNDVSITAADTVAEDGDRSVYFSRYMMCIWAPYSIMN